MTAALVDLLEELDDLAGELASIGAELDALEAQYGNESDFIDARRRQQHASRVVVERLNVLLTIGDAAGGAGLFVSPACWTIH